ncbi:peptidogalycan biosysnthesis protein [Umezawaea endophytica]|uniref:Peptidogalycan biosysnthesis protein n=1 Tax=Umezawaea endophytica TaxID=1654476 RepID=A0A9X3AE22_9PSEU|nr:peptidogalycan biosysnthesis protein [Umezawaea endophytica]MCS7476807.1 peptidogalycan biosysnthesis protein [Umezawaea endophytica]
MNASTSVGSCTVHGHLDDPEVAGRWSEAVRGGPPQLSVRWLTCHAGSFARPPSYVVANGADGRPDAVAVFHVRRPGDHHTKYRLEAHVADTSALPPGALDAPAVVVVAPSAYTSGLYVRDGLPPDRVHAAVAAVRRAVTEAGRAEGARTVLLPHLGVEARDWFADGVRFPMTPSAYLDLGAARSFDDYLATLPPKRRRETMRERRAFAAAGLSIRVSPTLHPIERLVERQVAHYGRYGLAADPARITEQFRSLAEHYGDDLLLFAVLRGTDEVGHVVVAREGEWMVAKLAGFHGRESYAYFEATYYAVIDWAVRHPGRTLIDYGGAAIDAKERRGCVVRPLSGAVLAVH